MSIRLRILLLGLSAVLVSAFVFLGITWVQSGVFAAHSEEEVHKFWDRYLMLASHAARDNALAQADVIQLLVGESLNMLEEIAQEQGGLSVGGDSVQWEAKNQFSSETVPVELPQMRIGGTWLGKTSDPTASVPLISRAEELSSTRFTVFQRMNDGGDMLRVATNVLTKDGSKRGIGTFIPAVMTDGTPNKVVAAVLKGEAYRGTAFVVDQWYVVEYRPLINSAGEVFGMTFAGTPQAKVSSLIEAFQDTPISENGYMAAIKGTGKEAGQLIVPPKGRQAFEQTYEDLDDAGEPPMKAVVEAALQLKDEEMGTFAFQQDGREMLVAYSYFEPWDWVVVGIAPAADFEAASAVIEAGRADMVRNVFFAAIALAALGGFLSWAMSNSLVKPLLAATAVLRAVAEGRGDLTARLQSKGKDEVSTLGRYFNGFVSKLEGIIIQVSVAAGSTLKGSRSLSNTAATIQSSSTRVFESAGVIATSSHAAVDSLESISQSMEQLNHAVDSVAKGSQEQAVRLDSSAGRIKEMATDIEGVASLADGANATMASVGSAATEGARSVEATIAGMARIEKSTQEVAAKIGQLGEAGQQIGSIVQGIEDIAAQTNLLALNAAIEAARAGEHGRGFAVVADEVRKLAEDVSEQTKSIAGLIGNVQSLTNDAVLVMEAGNREVQTGQQLARESGDTLQTIVSAASEAGKEIRGVRDRSVTLAKAANDVLDDVTSLAAITEQTSAATEQMAASSQEVTNEVFKTVEIGRQSATASREVGTIAEETAALAETVQSNAQKLDDRAHDLAALVGQFKTREGRDGDERFLLDADDPRVQERLDAIAAASSRSEGSRRYGDQPGSQETRKAA